MSIKYKVVERGEPGVKGGGTKKWYATVANNGEIGMDEMSKRIEKFSALSEADIRGVLIAMETVVEDALSNGQIVRMERLGTLYPALSSSGTDTEKDFNASLIKSASVNYRPSKRILDAIKAAGYEKVSK